MIDSTEMTSVFPTKFYLGKLQRRKIKQKAKERSLTYPLCSNLRTALQNIVTPLQIPMEALII